MPRKTSQTYLADAASLGLTLAASLVLFTYLGHLLDQWLATSPAFLLTGSLIGLFGGMLHVVRRANQATRRTGGRGEGPGASGGAPEARDEDA